MPGSAIAAPVRSTGGRGPFTLGIAPRQTVFRLRPQSRIGHHPAADPAPLMREEDENLGEENHTPFMLRGGGVVPRERAMEAAQAAAQGPAQPASVLIVDDSRTLRRLLVRALNDIGISDTTEAANGREALGLLHARLHAWRKEVGAQMPTPNPNYNPAKPESTPPPPKAKQKAKQ